MKLFTTLTFLVTLEKLSFDSKVVAFSTPSQLAFPKSSTYTSVVASRSLVFNPTKTYFNPKNHVFSSKTQISLSSSFQAVKPPPEEESTPSTSTSTSEPLFESIGKGIARDYKARLPLYASDITDGLNTQSLAATLFLFFACLAPAVGFGGLFGIATNGAIGTMEMVSSTAGETRTNVFIYCSC